VSSEPSASVLTAASPPTISVSGIYTGTSNDTLKFTISGAGSVGNGNLQLEVKDGAGTGDVIATLNIGSGYAAGDLLDLPNGIRVAIGVGDFNANNNFDVQVLASTDTSGLLAAVGMNTFFSGNSAANIAVCSDILDSPDRVAASLGPDMFDNTNVNRMAALKDQAPGDLDSLTPDEFYRRMVTDIGQKLSIKKMRQDNIEGLLKGLNEQQGELSGVNINDEAAKMMVFEQMFQAMAKYMMTVNSTISTLMDII
jgi:flagellar hook-associated protein 1 FlgK